MTTSTTSTSAVSTVTTATATSETTTAVVEPAVWDMPLADGVVALLVCALLSIDDTYFSSQAVLALTAFVRLDHTPADDAGSSDESAPSESSESAASTTALRAAVASSEPSASASARSRASPRGRGGRRGLALVRSHVTSIPLLEGLVSAACHVPQAIALLEARSE
jgi:hypothetical protein